MCNIGQCEVTSDNDSTLSSYTDNTDNQFQLQVSGGKKNHCNDSEDADKLVGEGDHDDCYDIDDDHDD